MAIYSDKLKDEELVNSAQQGNLEALNLLFERYYSPTYRRIAIKVPNEDVEDITQDVFIAMSRSLSSFRFESKFSTWMITLTNRKIADYYRKRKNIYVSDSISPVTGNNKIEHTNDGNIEDLVSLRKAFNTLPNDYQEILLQRFINNYQFNQIASNIGISLDAAKSRFRRSIIALREAMMEEEYG